MKRAFAATLLMALFLCGGCGKKPAVKKPEPAAQAEALKGAVTGTGWHIPWRERDPKNPTRTVPVLIADADRGALTNARGIPTAELRGVRVKIFDEGRAAANLSAARVTADRKRRILTGSGGCRLVSLDAARGTVLTADRMTWNVGGKRVEAEGNARVTGRAEDGTRFAYSGSRILYDVARDSWEGR